jgi:hypothetical protein
LIEATILQLSRRLPHSIFFSAEPAVSAPWVLASFPDGIEFVELPLAPVVPERTEDIQPSAASRISSN